MEARFDKPLAVLYVTDVRISWFSLSSVGVAIVSSACGIDIPEGPDLEPIAEVYERPTGNLVEEELGVTVEEARQTLSRIEELTHYEFLLETFEEVGEAVREVVDSEDGSLSVDGVTRVRRLCPGHERSENVSSENGSLEFQLTLRDSRLQDTIWGEFKDCRFIREGKPVSANGSLDAYLGGSIPLSEFRIERVLFRFNGDVVFDDLEQEVLFDFRVFKDGPLEVRVPVSQGEVVFGFEVDLEQAAVRGADHSYCCHFADRICAGLTGDDCDSPRTGDVGLSW